MYPYRLPLKFIGLWVLNIAVLLALGFGLGINEYLMHTVRLLNIKGRDFKTGMPKMVTLTSTEIYEVLRRPARQIADEVLAVLEETSPELVSDISENGITLTGGCSQIWGMDLLLMERTGIACILADDPDSCTAYGAGKSLAWINNMQEGPINIARKRAMRSGL